MLGVSSIPQAASQDQNIVDVNAFINISDVNFKDGKLAFQGLYLSIDANTSFGVYIFTTATSIANIWDNRTTYGDGLYSLSQQYFSTGFQLKFSLGGCIFLNDRLECGIVLGLNTTVSAGKNNAYVDLNYPLGDEWEAEGTITKVTGEEASHYALYGMSAINSSIRDYNLNQFYVLKIGVTRKFNPKNALLWVPPIFMFILLLFSLILVFKKELANSLLVYVGVDFFAFGYLSSLRDITPPILTSIESLTLVDVSLGLGFSIIAILWKYAGKKRLRKQEAPQSPTKGGSLPKNKQDQSLGVNGKSDEKRIDHAFDTFILIQTLIFATIFQYLTWLNKPDNLIAVTKITRVFFIPILIIIVLWVGGHLSESPKMRMVLKAVAWYWSFLSFLIQALFLGAILLLDILSPQVTVFFILLVVLFTLFLALFANRKLGQVYGESYSIRVQILSGIVSIGSMAIFLAFVLNVT